LCACTCILRSEIDWCNPVSQILYAVFTQIYNLTTKAKSGA
jgi:hypothetical protein